MILFLVTDLVSVRLVTRVKYAAAKGGFIGNFLMSYMVVCVWEFFPLQRIRNFRQLNYFKNLFFLYLTSFSLKSYFVIKLYYKRLLSFTYVMFNDN